MLSAVEVQVGLLKVNGLVFPGSWCSVTLFKRSIVNSLHGGLFTGFHAKLH